MKEIKKDGEGIDENLHTTLQRTTHTLSTNEWIIG